jgi:hypothetical protein
MIIKSKKHLEDIERRRNEQRKNLLRKKPELTFIEHIDYKANLMRKHKALERTPCLDDNKNAKLKDFEEAEE